MENSYNRKVDCFKYNFVRCVSAAVFLVGSLLLLAACTDITRSREKEKLANLSHDSVSNSLDNQSASRTRFQTSSKRKPYYKGNNNIENAINRYEEFFPDAHSAQKVTMILNAFRKKVALRNRKLINPHDFIYVHNVPNVCVGKKVEIVIGVPTRADSFEARQAIRESWGLYSTVPSNNAVLLFFLGLKKDSALQEKISAEALKYGDIVQENFIDSYRNLSLKTVALIKWVSIYCSDSTFVLKADDDMYINMPRLLMKLREQLQRGPVFILGAVHYNTEPFREQNNKWYVTFDEYPSNMFPNYMSGTAYAMTVSAAMRLYVESLYVHNLFLEDVYLTGIVADKAAVPRVREADFTWGKFDPYGCNFKDKISGHKNSPDEIRKIHNELFDPNLRCN